MLDSSNSPRSGRTAASTRLHVDPQSNMKTERLLRALRQFDFGFSASPSPVPLGRSPRPSQHCECYKKSLPGRRLKTRFSVRLIPCTNAFQPPPRRSLVWRDKYPAKKDNYNFCGEPRVEHTEILVPQTRSRETFDWKRAIARRRIEVAFAGELRKHATCNRGSSRLKALAGSDQSYITVATGQRMGLELGASIRF